MDRHPPHLQHPVSVAEAARQIDACAADLRETLSQRSPYAYVERDLLLELDGTACEYAAEIKFYFTPGEPRTAFHPGERPSASLVSVIVRRTPQHPEPGWGETRSVDLLPVLPPEVVAKIERSLVLEHEEGKR